MMHLSILRPRVAGQATPGEFDIQIPYPWTTNERQISPLDLLLL